MNATSVWSIRVARTVGTRDGQAGFSAASVPRQANKTKQTTNKNFIFFCGEEENREIHTAGFKEKHGQTEAGDAGTWEGEQTGRMHVCRKERGGRKGRKALKKKKSMKKKRSQAKEV